MYTDDTLLNGLVKLRQPKEGYRVSIDAVFLAAAVEAKPDEGILDAGAGVGAVSLCLAKRLPGIHITALEIQPELCELANYNARQNGFEYRINVVCGDLVNVAIHSIKGRHCERSEAIQQSPLAESAGLLRSARNDANININTLPAFHHIVTNPPYLESADGSPSPITGKSISNHGSGISLEEWINSCARLLKHKGTLTMIHRADRVDEILTCLHKNFGGITIFPLWPKAGQPAKRIIIKAIRGSHAPANILGGMAVHEENGVYTNEAEAILNGRHQLHVSISNNVAKP